MLNVAPPKPSWQSKVFPILIIVGWIFVIASFVIGLSLSSTASSYFGENTKESRDSAAVGDALLGDLETLTVTPRWLEPLTFLGVASFMVGIALAFSTIPNLLSNRGQVLNVCFPILVKKGE
jgi:hypothetical protein